MPSGKPERETQVTRIGVLVAFAVLASPLGVLAEEPAPEPKAGDEVAAPETAATPADAPAGAPAVTPDPEEQKKLEADMEAAKQKTAGVEEIQATEVGAASDPSAPAEAATVTATDDRPASVRLSDGDASERVWGALVILDHSMGTGTFLADSTLRGARAYVAQSWDLRPYYRFKFLDHNLKVSGRFVFELEMTQPDTNPARRFKPLDMTVTLSDANVYTEPVSGVTFNAGLRLAIPTSWESINVNKRWTAGSLLLGASRSFGQVYLEYSFGFTKNFNSTKGKQNSTDVPWHPFIGPARRGVEVPDDAVTVGMNASYRFSNSFAVTYNFTDNLNASYSLLIYNDFKYRQDDVNVIDGFASVNADDGRGRSDMLWPTLDVTYVLDELVAKVYPLPFSLMVSGGITSLHPAQTANNEGIMWPFFYQAMASNRAANNYASFYLDLVGVY
jgi:hypothetical protein